jgi:uncharacterized protein (TIGR02246 family)
LQIDPSRAETNGKPGAFITSIFASGRANACGLVRGGELPSQERNAMRRLHALSVAAAIAAVTIPTVSTAQEVEEAAKEAAEKWNEAFNEGDVEALTELYTEDAVILPPTETVVEGTDDIEEFWEDVIKQGISDHEIDIVDVEEEGDLAIVSGRWSAKDAEDNQHQGSVVNVLERQDDDTWRSKLHIWN